VPDHAKRPTAEILQVTASPQASMANPTPVPTSSPRDRARRILLVDDYDDARASTREALEQAGYVVLEAADGQQALNFLVSRRDEAISLIVLDLQMPVMDGWRLIELLHSYVNLATIPVLIVTASPEPHLERVSHPAVFGCLQAPYEIEDLLAQVESCLAHADSVSPSLRASSMPPARSGANRT
jgi:CheY-like chemotaxis protein